MRRSEDIAARVAVASDGGACVGCELCIHYQVTLRSVVGCRHRADNAAFARPEVRSAEVTLGDSVESPSDRTIAALPLRSTLGAFRDLGRHTALYGMSAGAVQLLGVITVPVFSRELSPSSYGLLELTLIAVALSATVVDCGLIAAVQRSFFDYSSAESDRRRAVVSTAFTVTAAVALLATIAVILTLGPLAKALYGRTERGILLLAALSIVPVAVGQFSRNVLRLYVRPVQYAISSFLSAGVGAASALVAVAVFHFGVIGVIGGMLIGYGLSAAYGLSVTGADLRAQPSQLELKRMLAFGLPLVPSGIALWLVWFIDRVMLARLASLDDVGQYAIANRLATILLLAVLAFNLAFGPFILSLHAQDRELERRVRAQTSLLVVALLAVLGVGLSLFAREIIGLVAPRYGRAHLVVGLLSLSIVIYGVYPVVSTGLSIARRTSSLGVISVAAAGVNVGLNLVLIPAWGLVGAAVSTVGAFAALTCGTAIAAQRIDPVDYPLGRLALVLASAIAAGAAALVSTGSEADDLVIKLGCLAGFTAVAGVVVVSSSRSALAFVRRS
jgi:O-antigen/teichoic acid export membrane protein